LNLVEENVIGHTGLEFPNPRWCDDEIVSEAIQTASGDVEEDTEDECDEVGESDEKIGLEEVATACKSSASTLTPMVYHCWRYRSSCEGCRHISAILLVGLVCRPLLTSSGVSSPSHEAAFVMS
jgi:hypothetical protein